MINIPYPEKNVLEEFYEIQKIEILKRIKAIKSQKKIQFNKKKYRVTKLVINVLTWLENEENLKKIILSKPKSLKKIIKIVESDKNLKKAKYQKEILYKILYRIFVNYGYEKIDKLKFIKTINLGSCPYCNRNYIFSVNKKGSIKPEIDHLYPKSIYPYLACSYFNLIPSCPTCNGFGAKGSKDTFYEYSISNPYNKKEIDFKFTIRPNNIEFIDKVKEKKYNFNSFDIEISGNSANIEIFKLKELYKQHKDIVLELLIKKAYYPKTYIEELSKFGFSEDEIYRYLFSNYKQDKDLHKRPLSKFIKDISSELGIL